MRIISNFHDYYDTVSTHETGKELIFKRESSIIEFEKPKFDSHEDRMNNFLYWNEITDRDQSIQAVDFCSVIGFCGKLYPVAKVEKIENGTTESHSFYSNENFERFIRETISEERLPFTDLEKFFKAANWRHLEAVFTEFSTPCFRVGKPLGFSQDPTIIEINPVLKNYSFAKVKDPYIAFQDLSLYLENQLQG